MTSSSTIVSSMELARGDAVAIEVAGALRKILPGISVDQACRIAAHLEARGSLNAADLFFQFILAVKPYHFDSLFGLARIRALKGQLDAARRLFLRAVALDVESAKAHGALGSVLAALGRHHEAVACYRTALAIQPNHARALCALGMSLSEVGQTDEAILRLRRAVAVAPDNAEAHFRLANVLLRRAQLPGAITHYRKVIEIEPRHPAALNNLANSLLKVGHPEAAVTLYQQALAIDPRLVDAHCNLGNALLVLNRNEEAIAQNQKALGLSPHRTETLNNIGIALQALGQIAEAELAYERAAQIAPRDGRTHLNLAYLRRFTDGDQRLGALEKLVEAKSSVGIDDLIAGHFALGKAYADLGQHERSFSHLREGNAIKRGQLAYDERKVLQLFDHIRAVFNSDLMKQKSTAANDLAPPVFVIGMPRSGTSLVDQILANHSRVRAAGAIATFNRLVTSFKELERSRDFPDIVKTMSADDLHDLGNNYIKQVRSAAGIGDHIVCKLPLNFMLAGFIHLALPNARIIHISRDPLDSCFSCFSLLFAGRPAFSYDLGELGRYYRGYEALMQHWREVLPAGVMIDVQYEKLVDDLEGEARAVIAHCGLEWQDACLCFGKTERSVGTVSAAQGRAPTYRSSIGRWRAYERFLQPLIDALKPATPAAETGQVHASA